MNTRPDQAADINYDQLVSLIKQWGLELGFNQVGIADIDLSQHEAYLQEWLDKQYHGDMDYMQRHGMKRARPDELHPGTVRVISARMDYLPEEANISASLQDPNKAYISRYATGRDYHKILRKRLKKLGEKIKHHCEQLNFRPFVDSAPVLERPLAAKAGLGWVGKHSLLLHEDAGSFFFLGELLINLPLTVDQPVKDQCGSCNACIKICPTQAIVAPYVVDSRRCISYLTIELKEAIPEPLRPLMGNRIYGCDDCQLVCPWNQYVSTTPEEDFTVRNQLTDTDLLSLFDWDEETFKEKMAGSAIYRIGYERWQRNIAVALGNCDYSEAVISALNEALNAASPMVKEHIEWALQQAQPGDSILISGRGRRRDTTNCDVDVAKRWLRDESEQPQIIRAAGYFAK